MQRALLSFFVFFILLYGRANCIAKILEAMSALAFRVAISDVPVFDYLASLTNLLLVRIGQVEVIYVKYLILTQGHNCANLCEYRTPN